MPIYYTTADSTWDSPTATTITNCTTATTTSTASYVTYWVDTGTGGTATTTVGHWYEPRYVRQRVYDNYAAEESRQAKAAKKHAKAARERAQELLLAHLTDEQRQTLKVHKWFVVEGGKSKQQYRIRDAGHFVANIDVLDGGKVRHRLCAHPDLSAFPAGDHLLAQKIMIEAAEDEFLQIANRHAA